MRLRARTAMQPDKTTIERAFDLARSGACRDVGEIIACLDREGYDRRQIHGRVLRKHLVDLIGEAKAHATCSRDADPPTGKDKPWEAKGVD